MIQFLYILFFLLLNIYIYLILNKIIFFNSYINLALPLFFIFIIIIHYLNLVPHQISKLIFMQMCIFSLILIAWFFFNKLLIKRINKKTHFNSFNHHISILIKKGIFIKVIFIMTTLSQIMTIIDMNL